MINYAAAPSFLSNLLGHMKLHPFSISIDGSNDHGLNKMNPMTVRIYDMNHNRVAVKFLDMCTLKQ